MVQEEENESVNSPSQHVSPEVGESLMVRRTVIKSSVDKEPPQRNTLFKRNCKCMGKVCKVLIDLGSTDNMVSLEMVEKLKLERIPHNTPYKVSWFNEGQYVLVREKFSGE